MRKIIIHTRKSLYPALALLLYGCVYTPASREDRYIYASSSCESRPAGDECAIKGKHAFYLDRPDEARDLWINSCFVHRRPNACTWLRRDFPKEYYMRREAELSQKPVQKTAAECPEPYESIRWVAQVCLEKTGQIKVMHPDALNCIDSSTGKVFSNDCDRALFFKGRWCKNESSCVKNSTDIPERVKSGF